MKMFVNVTAVYLHRDAVDFRKSINGLSVIVEQAMVLDAFCGALFVFRNRRADKLKILYWDSSGFCLWYKRLETERFKWPSKADHETLIIDEEALHWLLRGFDISQMKAHHNLNYSSDLDA